MTRRLDPYEPNPLLGWLYDRFFAHIEVDEAWAAKVREADAHGTVIYVLRSVSFVDFFALDHLTKRLRLPRVRFANDLGLWLLEPMGRGWLQALAPKDMGENVADLRRAVAEGASAVLFLKRPPGVLDVQRRGKSEGDPFLRELFALQRESRRPILLVPQVFVWSKFPDQDERRLEDVLLGSREWPGRLRTMGQFLANYRHVALRAGEPVDLETFLAQEGAETPSDDVLVRRLVYVLLRRLERERRSVLGPGKKSRERVREEVLRSPKLQKVMKDMAGEGALEQRVVATRATDILRELEADLDMTTVAALDAAFDQTFARMFTDIEYDKVGLERLRATAKDAVVVLLPSHKSHIDYLVLSYVLYTNHVQLPLIAAGDNLNFFPVGAILRNGGAFFIRRSFKGDRLYGAVVDAYMRRLILDGWSIEFFLEGGRSRTGKLLSPKLGLLNIVVEAALGAESRKVYFAPISIGYERMVEEDAFVRELSGGEKRKEDVRGLLSSVALLIGRYGRINVQFGDLLTLDQVAREMGTPLPAEAASLSPARRRALVTRLAYRVMNEINDVTAVTPGSLVAAAMLTHPSRGVSYDELAAASRRLALLLHGHGARFSPTLEHPAKHGDIREEAIREACELYVRAKHVDVRLPGKKVKERDYVAVSRQNTAAIFVVKDEGRLSLELAKNGVVHFLVSEALITWALGAVGREAPPTAVDVVRERVRFLSRLLKHEFQFRADANFDKIFDDTLASMVRAGDLAVAGNLIAPGPADSQARLLLYGRMIQSFLEGYRLAARAVALAERGGQSTKEIGRRALTLGDKMFLKGELELREAISRPLVENALEAFLDLGYLTRADGKIALAESYQAPEAARTIEARIVSFLKPEP